MNLEGFDLTKPEESDLKTEDRWILSLVNTLAKDVTENMDKYELGIAVSKVYDFIWEEFCDWYIEIVKPRMYNRDEDKVSANAALYTLKTVLSEALKLLHPYMPFITEEIYCSLNPDQPSIMISAWPQYDEKRNDAVAENILTRAKDLVRGMRTVRKDMNVPPSKKAALIITSSDEKVRKLFEENTGIYAGLAGASEVTVQEGTQGVDQSAVSFVIPDTTVYIPLNELVDMEKEKERLCKEQKRLEGELKRSRAMLSNEKFLSKAPEAKVAEEKEKLAQYEQMMADVTARLEQM
jgi:valyl-tRNA synthetase